MSMYNKLYEFWFELHFVYGVSYTKIADLFDTNVKTVRSVCVG